MRALVDRDHVGQRQPVDEGEAWPAEYGQAKLGESDHRRLV